MRIILDQPTTSVEVHPRVRRPRFSSSSKFLLTRRLASVDLLEAQIDPTGVGSASQSMQIAPFDDHYNWDNSSASVSVTNPTITLVNQFKGGINQETLSYATLTDATSYNGNAYQSYGFEYTPGGAGTGTVAWAIGGKETWSIKASAIGPNQVTQISQRIISEEPMAINLNFALSNKFQGDACVWFLFEYDCRELRLIDFRG